MRSICNITGRNNSIFIPLRLAHAGTAAFAAIANIQRVLGIADNLHHAQIPAAANNLQRLFPADLPGTANADGIIRHLVERDAHIFDRVITGAAVIPVFQQAADTIRYCKTAALFQDFLGRVDICYHLPRIRNLQMHGNLAVAAAEYGALLMHVSTDYVFGGDASVPYLEDSPVAPTGVYGVTKLDGERAVIESGCRHMIFRTAWLYSPYGKNFVKTIRRLVSEKDSINVVFDQVGTPTCAGDLAALIYMIIEKGMLDRTGIYHFSNEGVCSWYDFAIAIRDLSGYGQDGPTGHFCRISPCHSDEFPSKVKRPHYSVLDKTRVKSVFGVEIPHWMDSLKAVIEKMQYGSSQD